VRDLLDEAEIRAGIRDAGRGVRGEPLHVDLVDHQLLEPEIRGRRTLPVEPVVDDD
jgi:hypothetical protein